MTYRAGLNQMGTIGHLRHSAGKALGRKVGDPRDMFDWSCPLDESIVYKHYWLPVLAALKSAAFPLATLTPHLRGDQLGW